MSTRVVRTMLVAVPLLIIGIVGSLGYVAAQARPGNYVSGRLDLGTAPAWTLTDQNGQTVSSTAFQDKVMVVTYLFPYCTTFCPAVTHVLTELQADLKTAHLNGKRVQIVAFNVDPENTGPAQMRAFLQQYHVDPSDPGWSYVTGSKTDIDHVVQNGFGVYFQKISRTDEAAQIKKEKANGTYTYEPETPNPLFDAAKPSYDIVHDDQIEVVAPGGRISKIFSAGASVSETDLYTAVREAIDAR
jgi:protein SCO1/2